MIFRQVILGSLREALENAKWTALSGGCSKKRDLKNLDFLVFSNKTPLERKFDVADKRLLLNKRINLSVALSFLDGAMIYPGEKFSFWRFLKNPSKEKGYVDGMTLSGGRIISQTAGGLCQLSNMIFWMALHSPLQIAMRWRHGYDVFPDADRKIPFGCGATVAYPKIDLVLFNPTKDTFQLRFRQRRKYLTGEIRSDNEPNRKYEIIEKNPAFRVDGTGRFTRSNEIFRKVYEIKTGKLIGEDFLFSNSALTMYSPLIETDRGK